MWCGAVMRQLFVCSLWLGMVASQDFSDDEYNGKDFQEMNPQDLVRSRDHIKHHMEGIVDAKRIDDMSPEELDFYFFKLHDFDNNNRLDGLEIMSAVTHKYEDYFERAGNLADAERRNRSLTQLHRIIERTTDIILEEDDKDQDGYITYQEFAVATRVNQVIKMNPDNR